METTKFASLIFGLLLLSSCDKSNRVYEQECKIPPANWATEADQNRRLEYGGVIDPVYNVIDLDDNGKADWNGTSITRKDFETYLLLADDLDPTPMMILRIDGGTPCSDVEDVRKIMLRSATCQRPEKLCTEYEPESEPPPSAEKEANNIQNVPSE
jgi:hypothetical protein